ncbi:hypothetical protein HPB48_004986 [Haemaphysalis longicornis]|uniref:Protein cycle n=1 Tax=Haemaphysalis longicornis TaxID=44386 RepID=A0A9J6GEL8_HAELO|nr:hypothetical protein HPB48_004986 [Haemaphysalis longicornis]
MSIALNTRTPFPPKKGKNSAAWTGARFRQNHSEIEKRRRDKMNLYISEMSSLVPMCKAMSRKLDKLTVLRMAVQHIKTIRGSINSYTEGHYKPPWLSDEDVKNVVLQAADGFLFVVSCDRGRILFMSESVQQTLNYTQGDLLGQSWFDILHPKDIAKVKEQLSSSDLKKLTFVVLILAMLPLKGDFPQRQSRLCPGARRSFFCRMKCKTQATVKEEADTTTGGQRRRKSHSFDRRYSVIHCTGYLKSWAPAKLSLPEDAAADDSEGCNLSCLVAVGRVHGDLASIPPTRNALDAEPLEFVSRHAVDGKFLFVDKKATLILGYLPQELLGTACYEYYSQDDVLRLSECHKKVLQTNETVCTQPYKFRVKDGSSVCLQTKWRTFRNPWTKEFECLVAVNTLIRYPACECLQEWEPPKMQGSDLCLRGLHDTCLHLKFPDVQVPGSGDRGQFERTTRRAALLRLGCQRPRRCHAWAADGRPRLCAASRERKRSAHHLQLALVAPARERSDATLRYTHSATSPNRKKPARVPVRTFAIQAALAEGRTNRLLQSQGNSEGNDEAAMAVIMSLLEADAGLGGPVDFSGMPWPLP